MSFVLGTGNGEELAKLYDISRGNVVEPRSQEETLLSWEDKVDAFYRLKAFELSQHTFNSVDAPTRISNSIAAPASPR